MSRLMLILIVLVFSGSVSALDVQVLIEECESCHGPGGVSAEDDVPSIAGMDTEDLVKSIEEFYYYERHCTTTTYRSGDKPKTPMNMCNVANTLSEEDRQAIANYFAGG